MEPWTPTAHGVDDQSLVSLGDFNLALTVLHAAQAAAVLFLAGDFAIAVTQSLPTGPPGSDPAAPEALFDLPIGPAVAVFLALAAVDHLLTATALRRRHDDDLRAGTNVAMILFGWLQESANRPGSTRRTMRPGAQPGGRVGAGLADLRRVAGDLGPPHRSLSGVLDAACAPRTPLSAAKAR